MIPLPGTDRKWSVDHSSDIFGTIVSGKNLNFDKQGYVALAKKAMVLYSESKNASFQDILAIDNDATYIYVLTNNGFFYFSPIDEKLVVTKATSTSAPNFGYQCDMESFNGILHVSGTNSVHTFDPGTLAWTSRVTGLSTSYPHPLCGNGGKNTLLVGDGPIVHQYSTAYAEDTSNKLTLTSGDIVVRLIYRNSNFYVITRNINGGNAATIVWSGTGTLTNGIYRVSADWIYSACEYGSYIALVTSAGQMLEFNGAGYTELPHFPVYYAGLPWTSANATSNILGNVASRGMKAIGARLYININGALNSGQASPVGTYLSTMPSGLWKYDPSVGLYPLASPNYDDYKQVQPASIETNALVFSSAHGALTGDAILCVSQSGITGTRVGQTYYAIVIGPLAFQLALSPAEAFGNHPLTLSGTPDSNDLFSLDSYGSMGSGQVSNAGAVFVMKGNAIDLFYAGRILFGSRVFTNSFTNRGVLMGLGYGRNIGYFVTAKIGASDVRDAFEKLVARFPHLNLDSQSIQIKYRVTERFGLPGHAAFTSGSVVVFTSTTTFTVATASKDVHAIAIGDEIEFIIGAAAGYIAIVTAINTDDPTSYLFTIDTALPVSNGDYTDFIADNWEALTSMTNTSRTNTQNFGEKALGNNGIWVQFKVVLAGRDLLMEQMLLLNEPNRKLQ